MLKLSYSFLLWFTDSATNLPTLAFRACIFYHKKSDLSSAFLKFCKKVFSIAFSAENCGALARSAARQNSGIVHTLDTFEFGIHFLFTIYL